MLSNLSPSDRANLSLSYGDYLRFSALMQERFGLIFPERRRMELEIGVRRAFSTSTAPDLDSYYRTLLDPAQGAMELERLVNHLTVGETYFFRDTGQFEALTKHVLPQIIERRRAVRTLRIWSAGCATGEEPYSIAMLLRDLLPDIDQWAITILATDINTQNIERARRGVYTEWAFREVRAREYRPRCFTQNGNLYEIDPEIKRMVSFRQINLADDCYPSYETNTMFMDLILCRNVTIYFPEAVTQQVVNRFYSTLVEGGWFIIGHSEHSIHTYQRFQIRNFPDAILYQRPSDSIAGTVNYSVPQEMRLPAAQSAHSSLFLFSNQDRSPSNSLKIETPVPAAPPVQSLPAQEQPAPPEGNAFEQAKALMAEGKVDVARDLLLRFIQKRPHHAAACSLLGKAYANMGNWPEAERWCYISVELDKLNLEAYYTLALVYQHQVQHERAIEMMKKVVYIDRGDILGHFSLADLYHSQGMLPQAIKSLENARRLLDSRVPDELVPRSEDVSVGRLAQTVLELQQLWISEAGHATPAKAS
jgi:chemotaxis protein methyltransferase CheR